MIVETISGAWRSQIVHIIKTAAQQSHPINPHNLLLERLPFSADRRDETIFVIDEKFFENLYLFFDSFSESLPNSPMPTVRMALGKYF